MEPITRVYTVTLTAQEFDHLYRLAPDGIQTAMDATKQVASVPCPRPPRREDGPHTRRVRESRETAAG